MPLIKLFVLPLLIGLGLSGRNNQPPATGNPAAQELFKYIRCHRQAKNIVINWGVSSITGVDHFEVYHSEIGDFFDRLDFVDTNGEEKGTYKHLQVFPGYHYYYVRAVMITGPPVDSPVDVVRIVGH